MELITGRLLSVRVNYQYDLMGVTSDPTANTGSLPLPAGIWLLATGLIGCLAINRAGSESHA